MTVYPRVGGGNARRFSMSEHKVGLSPRGRGKRGVPRWAGVVLRSIPAWAGET